MVKLVSSSVLVDAKTPPRFSQQELDSKYF